MKVTELNRMRKTQKGQTLIMALIILGVLLVLGMVFIGIVNRNIVGSSRMQARSVSTDIAEAGVRYVHMQMLNSPERGDWRGSLVSLSTVGDFTRDPDALYLRAGTRYGLRSDADPQIDLGGPDGLGPFTRINYENGRALVRARYAPSDFNIYSTSPAGALRSPGKVRNYTIIESVGRTGKIDANDPTTLTSNSGIQFRNYANGGAFRQALGDMKNRDTQITKSRKVIAFATIGIIEDALFITDKYQAGQPAELGFPDNVGIQYEGNQVNVPIQFGQMMRVYNYGDPPTPYGTEVTGGGSIWSNADLIFHGDTTVLTNSTLGDSINIAGMANGANASTSRLTFDNTEYTGGAWVRTPTTLSGNSLDSRDPSFSTLKGLFRDSYSGTDVNYDPRGVARKDPPSILTTDPDSGINGYLTMTRDSGKILAAGNCARFGHGRNVYVNNFYDKQLRSDAEGRADVGSAESLVFDWLNPNNGQQGSGWKGPYYCPPGAYVILQQDGFTISRDGSNRPAGSPDNQRTWRRPDGTDSGLSTIRYRIGNVTIDGRPVPYIINTLTPGVNINVANPDFSRGFPFNGVLFFEGNIRVRGVIPTDRQLTVLSLGSIYIEGSITKGIIGSNGSRITTPSRSTLMLIAKDYVAVNTSQFFGPSFGQTLDEVSESTDIRSWNPLRVSAGDGLFALNNEFIVNPDNPATTRDNPSTYRSFLEDYRQYDTAGSNSGAPIDTHFLLSHTMDDGVGSYSFISMDVNYGLPDSPFLFELTPTNAASTLYPTGYVTPGYTTAGFAPIYGLGAENWQRYSKIESNAFRLMSASAMTATPTSIVGTGPEGRFTLLLQETGQFMVKTSSASSGSSNDYLVARTAITPHDIRIEAAVYAEEGSFFVIPGNWFNPNPDDTRERYQSLGATTGERDQARLESWGAFPWTPFYGEPIDVRVTIVGSVSENMPVPIAQQGEWLKKWGWIPREIGATGQLIPWSHVPTGVDIKSATGKRYVPNLIISYDPVFATGRTSGYDPAGAYVRTDDQGRSLPPMPRLPVSPTLSYFGEVNP